MQFRKKLMSVAVAALTLAAPAFAQDDDSETTQTDMVEMNMQMPGMDMNMNMNVNMNVRQTSTRTKKQAAEAAPTPAPAPEVVRDCGTGQDPGCNMKRNGEYPMDAETFSGLLTALRSNHNEIEREEMATSTFSANYLTSKQLAAVLDLFRNEITRLDVAKAGVGKLVNPKHALGLGAKFQNSIHAGEFTEAVNAQR